MSTSSPQPVFTDLFRHLLAWRSAHGYVIPISQRKKLPPDGLVHVPTAVRARVQS